jgi:raffinose/stachyose/melibiose transport system permease protein
VKRQARRQAIGGRLWPFYVLLAAFAAFSLLPMLVLGFNSVKSGSEIGSNPLGPPLSRQWSNFTEAWTQGNIGQGLINTALLTTGTVVGIWFTAGLAAYALARLPLPGSGAVLFYLLVMTALPVQMFLVPLFYAWSRAGLYDSLLGLVIIHIALAGPFCTLLLRSYFLTLPKDFEEAARLDGAGELTVMARIVIPLAWPGFLTVGLVAGLFAYNDLFFATIFIQTDDRMPVSTAFLRFQQGFSRDWGLTSAGGVLIAAPIILLFIMMQRRFIEGLTTGGLRG